MSRILSQVRPIKDRTIISVCSPYFQELPACVASLERVYWSGRRALSSRKTTNGLASD